MTTIVAQSGVKLPVEQVSSILNGRRPLSEKSWAEWFFSFFSQLLKYKTACSELETIYQKINIHADDDSDVTQLEKLDNYLTLMQLTKHEYIENYNLVYTKQSNNTGDFDFRYQGNSLFIMTVTDNSVTHERIKKIFNVDGKLRAVSLYEHSIKLKYQINNLVSWQVGVYNKKEGAVEGSMQYCMPYSKVAVRNYYAETNIEPLNTIFSFLLDFYKKNKSNCQLKFYLSNDYSFIRHQVIPEVYRAELLVNGQPVCRAVKPIQKEMLDIIKDEFIQQGQLGYHDNDMSLVFTLNDKMNVGQFIKNTNCKLIDSLPVFLSSDEHVFCETVHLNSVIPAFISNRVNPLITSSYGVFDYFSESRIRNHNYINNGALHVNTLSVLGNELYEQVDWIKETIYPMLVESYCDNQYLKNDIRLSKVDLLGVRLDKLHTDINSLQNEIGGYKQKYEKESDFFLTKSVCCDLSLKIKEMVKENQLLCKIIQGLCVV